MTTQSHLFRYALLVSLFGATFDPALAWGQDISSDEVAVDPQTEPMKVLVGTVAGAKGSSARKWLVQGIEEDPRFELIDEDVSVGLKIGASEEKIAEAALGVEADVVILARGKFGRGWSAEVSVFDGKDGHLIEMVKVKGPSWGKYETALVSGELFYGAVMQAEGFPPPPPEPIEEEVVEEEESDLEEEPQKEEEEDDTSKGARPSPLDIRAGLRLYSRSFRYTDTLADVGAPGAGQLEDYTLSAAPMAMINGHWYPAAHFTGNWASNIGLTGGVETGFATKINDGDVSYTQNHLYWYTGLRGRLPVGPALLGLNVNYGGQSIGLQDDAGNSTDRFPDISYSFIEIGGDVEFRMSKLILGLGASYLLNLGVGEIGSDEWFPNASAQGAHFEGHVGWGFTPWMDALVGIEFWNYGFDFNPVPTDRPANRVAGGATDRYTSLYLALRFVLPGDEPKGGEDAASSADSDGDDFDDFD